MRPAARWNQTSVLSATVKLRASTARAAATYQSAPPATASQRGGGDGDEDGGGAPGAGRAGGRSASAGPRPALATLPRPAPRLRLRVVMAGPEDTMSANARARGGSRAADQDLPGVCVAVG